MCDVAVESDGNWLTEVYDGVGKAIGHDICASRNCKRYRNAMVQAFKLVMSRQENPNAPRRPGKIWWSRIVSRSERD